jgi:RNA polymerase sigma factor (sigma-70 family)
VCNKTDGWIVLYTERYTKSVIREEIKVFNEKTISNVEASYIAQIYDAFKTDIFRFSLSIVRDIDIAQDVTQDVFLNLLQSISQISDRGKIKSWLLSTTKNVSLNMLRKRTFEISEEDTSSSEIQSDTYHSDFFDMLDCLDEIDRQIVTLHIVAGLKHREIAVIMSLQPGIVRQRYVRSLKHIRNNLYGGYYDEQ